MHSLVVAVALLLGATEPAAAGFLVPFIAPALVGTFAGGALAFGLDLAASFGLSFIASKLLAKPRQAGSGGAQLDIRVDALVPQSLIVGRAVTAGSLVNAATFGASSNFQNNQLIEIVALADHTCQGLVKVFVEGNEVTLMAPAGDRGQGIEEYISANRPGSQLAVKFFNGSQTAADAFSVNGGRLIELGGVFKLHLDVPGLPVFEFTDDQLLAGEEEVARPLLGLQQRLKLITGNYLSPSDGWVPKAAPQRRNADWELEDGRRLPADLDAPMVQSPRQMQQVMQQLLDRSRRQRKHTVHLPPSAFHVEPGQTVAWTSATHGYADKLFEVDGVEYYPDLTVTLAITEVDPADYDWEPSDQLPEIASPPISTLPAPKVITNFDAEPFIHTGDVGANKPAIRLTWDPPDDADAIAVLWQLRRAADPTNVMSGRFDDVEAGQVVIAGGLNSNTLYVARARFESFEGHASDWSLWQAVTTPDVDEVLSEVLEQRIEQVGPLQDLIVHLGERIAAQDRILDTAVSQLGDLSAQALFRMLAVTSPADALAMIEMQVRSSNGAGWAQAGLQLAAYANADGTEYSRLRLFADLLQFGLPGFTGGDFKPLMELGTRNGQPAIVLHADAYADDAVGKKQLALGAATTIHTFKEASAVSRLWNAWNNGGNFDGDIVSETTIAVEADGVVIIDVSGRVSESANHGASGQANLTFRLYINGGMEFSRNLWANANNELRSLNNYFRFRILKTDLPAGTNTLQLRMYVNQTSGSSTSQVDDCTWIVEEYHKPVVQSGGAADATVTYHDTVGGVNQNDPTYVGVPIGPAAANRSVKLAIATQGGNNIAAGECNMSALPTA